MSQIIKTSISVVGLGKLGLPFALCFAHKSFNVIGYDINKSWIEALKNKISPITEPFAQELLLNNNVKLSFTQNPEDVISKSDITFIVVPTPSNRDGSFSSKYIQEVLSSLAPYIKKKKKKHVIVITSTISPKTTQDILKPFIEKLTGKIVGVDLGLCYSPELIALGSVVKNIQNPDFLFIGESDEISGALVERIRKKICANTPQAVRTSWINIEIAKLSLNAYITMKINFANMVARLSENTKGADSDIILGTIGKDSRIGEKYLKGGLGFGGPCFPRDNLSLAAALKAAGISIDIPHNTHLFNKDQIRFIFGHVKKTLKSGQTVGILGLSYKPDTDVVEESQGILLASFLMDKGILVLAHDPTALVNARRLLPKLNIVENVDECISKSDVLILTTQWSEYKKINWSSYSNKIVIDCWRMVEEGKFKRTKNSLIQLGKYINLP